MMHTALDMLYVLPRGTFGTQTAAVLKDSLLHRSDQTPLEWLMNFPSEEGVWIICHHVARWNASALRPTYMDKLKRLQEHLH